jgi:hypothetical protein
MSNAASPYAPPAARVDDVSASANPEAEAIRRAHINHEASIKSVGLLYYLSSVATIVGGVGSTFGVGAQVGPLMAFTLVAVGVGGLFAGYGVRALRPWGRIAGCILSALGLLGFPIGTLINGYILYLFLSKKGRTIFAPEYQDIIAATPHVKYRTSIIVWIFLALVIALVVLAFALPMLTRFSR